MYVLTYFISIFIVPQVYDGHSNFLLNLSVGFNHTNGSLKLPIGNVTPVFYDTGTIIVSSLYFHILVTPFAHTVPGWNLFAAAMTPNNYLCLNLIKGIHDRASLYGNRSLGAFPLRYGRINDADVSGMGR